MLLNLPRQVLLLRGCGKDLVINLLLTILLLWLGGMVHAIWIALEDASQEDKRRQQQQHLPVAQPPAPQQQHCAGAAPQPPYPAPQGAGGYYPPQLPPQPAAAGYPVVMGPGPAGGYGAAPPGAYPSVPGAPGGGACPTIPSKK